MAASRHRLDCDSLRRRLATASGPRFWRGLEEIAETEEFRRFLAAEFPSLAGEGFSRRSLLRAMGASLMLAGLAGCGEPPEEAVPYVKAPEDVVPGRPRYYATAALLDGFAQPVLGETHVGRPTKLEGNPEHPASLGATDAFTQAAVLQLYDPDRSQSPTHLGQPATWSAFQSAMVDLRNTLDADSRGGLRILTGATTSPTLLRQIDEIVTRFPGGRWHVHEPVGSGRRHAATRKAFGRSLDTLLHLDRAAVVVSLDDDMLGPGPWQVFNARRWGARRQAAGEGTASSRLHVAESTPTLTGSVATSRLPAASGRMGEIAAALAGAVGVTGIAEPITLSEAERGWCTTVAADLRRHPGGSLLLVSAYQRVDIQLLGLRINEALGNIGSTVEFIEPVAAMPPDGDRSLECLVEEMASDRVAALLVLDTNPAYTAPRDLHFAAAMQRVGTRIHAGLYYDETAAHCHWHLPLAHPLESWGDARAVTGTVGVLQPLVRPFYDVRSGHEILATIMGAPDLSRGQTIVRETWRARLGDDDFEARWRRILHDGFVEGSEARAISPPPVSSDSPPPSGQMTDGALEVILRPDPTVWDGRFANLGWLQELPKPLTKVTWENVVAISPRVGERLGVTNGDTLVVGTQAATVAGPAWITPGQAERTVTIYLGYGRSRAGRVGTGLGYDAYRIRTTAEPWRQEAISVRRGEGHVALATTQLHFSMEGFDFVRVVSRDSTRASRHTAERSTLYPIWDYDDPSWGMAIDLDRCIGCNACVVACQAENNIPVVGKEQVGMGREMHWLRIDRYYEGDLDAPRMHFQPVPCMHCEKAPCEMGCPVNATVHGPEGLNQMIYNRCIGTRTCSSFCPYKVRRFNWYDYTGGDAAAVRAQRNPDVTVRNRGVMEKCTYCVQRISAARIAAKKDGRAIADGEVKTACQAVCPTNTIVFGNIRNPDSAVSRAKASPRDYSLLEHLNTWPRTTYLARIADSDVGEGHDQ